MESFDHHLEMARRASAQQDWAAALAAWRLTSENFPGQAEGFVGEAETLMAMGGLDQAEMLLTGVIDRFPDEIYVSATHARIAARRQDWGEALMRWGAVRQRFPDHPIPYVGQGEVLLNIGQLALAEAAFAKAVRLAEAYPEYEWAAINHADVAMRRGDWSEALDRWEVVRTRFPRFAIAWTKCAEALDRLGRADEAGAILRLAGDLFPGEPLPPSAPTPAPRTRPQSPLWSGARPIERRVGLSAYLSIFNDWDILACALDSVAPLIDELVVIDGAYKWMAPYLEAIGCNPERSNERVYQIIENAGLPFRIIANTWENEAEKRMAGYDACRNRFICRVDADEVLFADRGMIESFLKEGAAAAEMEAPLYISPGWIVTPRSGPLPRAGFLFDSEKIGAADHLRYLWLISDRPQVPARSEGLFPKPVAFNAHLTHWRTPSTATGRAAFYALNYVRSAGAPWFSDLRSQPLPDLARLFARIPPTTFHDTLNGSLVVAGYGELRGSIIGRSPVPAADEQVFYSLFDDYLLSHAQANAELAERGRYTLGRTYIDLTSPEALAALTNSTTIALRFSDTFTEAKVCLQYLTATDPWEEVREIEAHADGPQLRFDIPRDPSQFLRRVLRVDTRSRGHDPVQRFVVER